MHLELHKKNSTFFRPMGTGYFHSVSIKCMSESRHYQLNTKNCVMVSLNCNLFKCSATFVTLSVILGKGNYSKRYLTLQICVHCCQLKYPAICCISAMYVLLVWCYFDEYSMQKYYTSQSWNLFLCVFLSLIKQIKQ